MRSRLLSGGVLDRLGLALAKGGLFLQLRHQVRRQRDADVALAAGEMRALDQPGTSPDKAKAA
jgi:hypothetical protein